MAKDSTEITSEESQALEEFAALVFEPDPLLAAITDNNLPVSGGTLIHEMFIYPDEGNDGRQD